MRTRTLGASSPDSPTSTAPTCLRPSRQAHRMGNPSLAKMSGLPAAASPTHRRGVLEDSAHACSMHPWCVTTLPRVETDINTSLSVLSVSYVPLSRSSSHAALQDARWAALPRHYANPGSTSPLSFLTPNGLIRVILVCCLLAYCTACSLIADF